MRNFLLYCKDFEKYGNGQKWTLKIMGERIKFYTIRSNNQTWLGVIELKIREERKDIIEHIHKNFHNGIFSFSDTTFKFTFSGFYDYKPKYFELNYYSSHLSEEKINDLKYWTFPEVREELERLAFIYLNIY